MLNGIKDVKAIMMKASRRWGFSDRSFITVCGGGGREVGNTLRLLLQNDESSEKEESGVLGRRNRKNMCVET